MPHPAVVFVVAVRNRFMNPLLTAVSADQPAAKALHPREHRVNIIRLFVEKFALNVPTHRAAD
jgi:hypothetical protein